MIKERKNLIVMDKNPRRARVRSDPILVKFLGYTSMKRFLRWFVTKILFPGNMLFLLNSFCPIPEISSFARDCMNFRFSVQLSRISQLSNSGTHPPLNWQSSLIRGVVLMQIFFEVIVKFSNIPVVIS